MDTAKREHSPSDDGHSAKRIASDLDWGLTNRGETGTSRRIDIVADGDAIVIVGEEALGHNQVTAFTVRSSTVLAASDKLTHILFLSVPEAPVIIPGLQHFQLLIDNPKPMATLLRILHAQFDQVPSDKPDIVEIHEIAMLAEKFDMMRLLRPWARQWMKHFAASSFEFGDACRCLSIAWLFGDQALFRSTVENIARRCRVYQYKIGTVQNAHRLGFPTYEVPGIYETVGDQRLMYLKSLLVPLDESVDKLVRGVCGSRDEIQCRIVDPHDPDSSCNLSLLATLIRSLVSAELWPVPKADLCLGPFNDMNRKVRELEVVCKPSHQKYGCDNILSQGIPRWFQPPQATLSKAQVKHLNTQAEKTGLKSA